MNEPLVIPFEQIMSLVEKAIIVVALIAMYKSVPASLVRELRQDLSDVASKTTTPLDDIGLQLYDYLTMVFGDKERLKQLSENELHTEERANKDGV